MAFGFGFNKQKALSAAEKFVQQGKLPNAIAEYEKVLKADPKELTVSNTIGDLYARLGQADKAVESFKSVGDAYAAQGFTVKAIAMYKKLTKLTPGNAEATLKLAELYTQQGLYNDARAQYVVLAEQSLKGNDLDSAARSFQKILELDPELRDDRHVTFEVDVPDDDVPDFVKACHAWHDELFRIVDWSSHRCSNSDLGDLFKLAGGTPHQKPPTGEPSERPRRRFVLKFP